MTRNLLAKLSPGATTAQPEVTNTWYSAMTPQAAKKIAEALADKKPKKELVNKVPYYKITHNGKEIVVGCAVGHLYGLAEVEKKKGFQYPVFDIHWVPTSEISKGASFSKKYLNVLKKIAKGADIFTVATDYDVEGEVIGLNVVRYTCKKKDARRMKFSTLTKNDLISSYEHAATHLDWPQAEAGETRHKLDWYYGINLSRAMTTAITKSGMFKILSTGRVQGPALKIIVDREKEIKAFKPVPYWQIELDGTTKGSPIIAWHKEDKFWDKKKADEVMKKLVELDTDPQTVRATMGSLFALPIVRLADETALSRWHQDLRAAGLPLLVVASSAHGQRAHFEVDYNRPLTLLVGSERHGLPSSIREEADVLVRLPMVGRATSLNVAAATAALVYEVIRQRSVAAATDPGTGRPV